MSVSVILGKHPFVSNDNVESVTKKEKFVELLSPRIPGEILDTILQNIKTTQIAIEKLDGAQIKQPYFSLKFNRISGNMQLLMPSEEMEKAELKVDFIFVSPLAISIDSNALSENLEASGVGITMTAAKILTLMIHLFSTCSEVKGNLLESTQTQIFVSLLNHQTLTKLNTQVIADFWECRLNNYKYYPYHLNTQFLIGLRYLEHEVDERYSWKSEWKSNLLENEILVIERSDKVLRFCKVLERTKKTSNLLLNHKPYSTKERDEAQLSLQVKKRW